jgi:hypothetical protein
MILDMMGDSSDLEANAEGADADTGEEEYDEEYWSEESMLDH